MTDATPESGGGRRAVTGEVERGRRARFGRLAAAVLVALPGAYAAIRTQSAADEQTVETEVVVRDRQETAFRKHIEALTRKIAAVQKAAVTHKDLLDLVVKLRDRERVYRPRSPRRRTEATAREKELDGKLSDLRGRGVRAAAASARASAVQRALPKLKSSGTVRKAVKNGF